jgi:hypothetical protein
MNRYTFVVRIHPEGISTLENLSTYERIKVTDLALIGPQIERWLVEQPDSSAAAGATKEIQ